MAKLIAGTVISLSASHKRYRKYMDGSSFVAKTSLWAHISDSSGDTHKVWVGKIRGRCGVTVKEQEKDLVANANFLVGKSVSFSVKRDGFEMLYGIKGEDYSTMDAFIAELKLYSAEAG